MNDDDDEKEIKLVRVIFRTFDDDIFDKKGYSWSTLFNVWLAKQISIPFNFNGFKYDHVELLTPRRQRVSIRLERKDKYGMNEINGVYCWNVDGFGKEYEEEIKERKYKLVFTFQITDKQETKLYSFLKKHKGEYYGLKTANVNVFLNKVKSLSCGLAENYLIDEYTDQTKKRKTWDCVTLILRILLDIELIPEFRKDGTRVNLLGQTAFDMAQLLLDMYKNKELKYVAYVVSSELQSGKDYKKGIDNFYRIGAKLNRTGSLEIKL